MSKPLADRLGTLIANALTWAFAGIIFGAAFSALHDFWLLLGFDHRLSLVGASVLAGMVTAGFFGGLVVAMAGTLAGIIAAISYQILFSDIHRPELLMLAAFLLGLLSGLFFSRRELAEYQPLGQASSGLVSGLLAGLILMLPVQMLGLGSNDWQLAATAVALVGSGYVFLARHIPRALCKGVMLRLGGPLVCALISLGTAFAFWLIGESMDMHHWADEPASRYFNVLINVPAGALGGAIGGALGGIGMGLLGIRFQRHSYVV